MENPPPGFEPPPAAPLDGVEPEGIVKFPNELEVEAPPAADVGGLWLVKPVIPPIPAKLDYFFVLNYCTKLYDVSIFFFEINKMRRKKVLGFFHIFEAFSEIKYELFQGTIRKIDRSYKISYFRVSDSFIFLSYRDFLHKEISF